MKKFICIFVVVLAFTACKTDNQKVEDSVQQMQAVKSETPLLAIADFDEKAGEYVSKEVKVEGIVDHVCKHGGKKLLLVTDDGNVHVTSDERFEESLIGSEIALHGIVVEERIDEAYCLKMEEDNIKSHSEGQTNDEMFEAKKKHIQDYRDQMKANNTDHISNYSLKFVSLNEMK
jgi:hypothetical protein